MKKIAIALMVSIALFGSAHAQSSPGLYNGLVPTAAQWNSYFASKQDYLGVGSTGQVLTYLGGRPVWSSAGSGTVTNVSGSGGTTGMTLTGGPITGIGQLTLGGNLNTSHLNSGTNANSGTFWRGDGVWAPAFYGTGVNAVSTSAGATSQALFLQGTYTGNGSNPYALINVFDQASSSGSGLVALTVNESFGGGSTGAGNRTAFSTNLLQTAATPGSGTEFYTGAFINVESQHGDGGTALAPRGAYFGIGGIATLRAGATHVGAVQEAEFDVAVEAGASVLQKSVLTLVGVNNDAVQGSVYDAMLGLLRDASTTTGFNYGIAFGRQDALWPITATGSLIGSVSPSTGSRTAADGVDMRNISFSDKAFASTGFGVDGSGNVTATSVNFGGTSLNAYVEGSWTPTVNGASTSGTGQTYAGQVGSYEQIGRQVTARFTVAMSSVGTASGNLLIKGLPIPSANAANDNGVCTISFYSMATGLTLGYGVTGIISPNSSQIAIYENQNTSSAVLSVANLGAAGQLVGVCNYHT